MNVALVSPSHNAYSETFIQAHKKIDANVFYYYGGTIPNHLEGYGVIEPKSGTLNSWVRKFWRRIRRETFSVGETEFIKSLQDNEINVVFAEFGITGAELVHLCKRIHLPLVTIFHGYDAYVHKIIQDYKIKYLDLFQYAGKIIVVSEAMKSKLISLGCPDYKIVYTPCAPNDMFCKIKPIFSEQKSFIAVGRFDDKKAPYYTLLSIRKVAEKYPDVKLYYAGLGTLYETVKNLTKYFKLENNVKLLGIITPNDFVSLLIKATGFIQHSITSISGDMEGTPVAILEASAAGIPVVSTRHGGISEVIIDGKTGFLVDEHDVDGMALNIIKLIENPGLAKEMGHYGKENIIQNFSMEKHLYIIKSTLDEVVISGKNGRI